MDMTELFFVGLAIVSLIGFLITLIHHRNYRKQHPQHS
jgi:preprotein translocase subunit Sss1